MKHQIEIPVIRRYLAALTFLAGSNSSAAMAAREALRDMSQPGVSVHEYIAPLATLPADQLTPCEQVIRLHAKGLM